MTTSTHTIYEHGNGFPGVGERVYISDEDAVYTVVSVDSDILTRQYEAGRVRATLEYECDAADLADADLDAIRDLRIQPLA